MGLRNLRQGFNDSIREWGNNRTSWMVDRFGKGLGDMLTANVNFRKVGATAGILAPFVPMYLLLSNGGENPIMGAIFTPVYAISIFPATFFGCMFAGGMGYVCGEKVDSLLGDTSRRGGLYGMIVKHSKEMAEDWKNIKTLKRSEYEVHD